MKRAPSPVKVRQWTERLARFEQSGQTVAQFCRQEGVSQPSFYQWRKKLDWPAVPTQRQIAVAASSRNAGTSRRGSATDGSPPSPFRPVQWMPPVESAICLTVRLSGGVELALGDHLPMVELVVGKVLEHAAANQLASKSEGPTC